MDLSGFGTTDTDLQHVHDMKAINLFGGRIFNHCRS
jgi:hypothetical protein